MASREVHVVTGAFGYSGRYIAERLIAEGREVRTLTNSPGRNSPLAGRLAVSPLAFDRPDELANSLRGARVLYNTYWVRFNHRTFTHAVAVRNSLALFEAAKRAGVERVVHVSITNPSEASRLEYFSGKAKLESALRRSGLSYAILRPTVLFGKEDILVNNIAWMLRRFPVFGVFGDGRYKLQPIFVDDLAALAVEQGRAREDRGIDAIGPETFTYRELVATIGDAIGRRRPIIGIPPVLGYAAGWLVGRLVGDVVVTREEIDGLMQGLLETRSPPAGGTRLTDWARAQARAQARTLGLHYASELGRRADRAAAYAAYLHDSMQRPNTHA